jgi:hypothetical protein
MNTFSRFFVISLAGVLLPIAAVNWAMDPYALFDTQRIDNFNRYKPTALNFVRLSKGHQVNAGQYETLILGSSRTGRGLNCSMLGYQDERCFNASTTAASLLESYRYLQQQSPEKLRTVYLGLDLFTSVDLRLLNASFVDERLRIDINEQRNLGYVQQLLNDYLGSLLSKQALDASRVAYRSQGKAVVMRRQDGMPEVYPDGSWGNDPTRLVERGGNIRGKKQLMRFTHMYLLLAKTLEDGRKEHEQQGLEVTKTLNKHLDALRKIIEFSHRYELDLKIFFNAAHAYHWQMLYQDDQGRLLDYWKRQVVAINESAAARFAVEPFSVFDFSGINLVSTEQVPSSENGYQLMTGFQDIMHYSLSTGREMVSLMEAGCQQSGEDGWGACVDPDTLAGHQRRQRTQFKRFIRSDKRAWAVFERAVAKDKQAKKDARAREDSAWAG